MSKMKKNLTILALAALFCASCGEDIERQAQALLGEARIANEAQEYDKARLLLDSLRATYPKAFKARREALELTREVEYGQQSRSVCFYDEQLASLTAQRDSLLREFILEKDTRYQDEGNYMLPSQTLKSNYGLTYLRAQVSEKGVAYITSVYRGKAIEHTGVRLSVGDTFVECTEPVSRQSSKHLGVTSERLNFRYGADGGIMDFIASAQGDINVKLTGKHPVSYTLRREDASAVVKTLELAKVLQSIESVQAMRAEAARHIEFIERSRERFEGDDKPQE